MAQRQRTKRSHRSAAATVVALVVLSLTAPAATAKPSEDKLERARSAVAIGQEKAQGLANGNAANAPGQEHRAQGLERAAAAIAAAAERKAARDAAKEDAERLGRGLGRGHAAEVHSILADGSPSELPPHGESVRALAHAYKKVKADHPGQGQGRTEKGESGAETGDD